MKSAFQRKLTLSFLAIFVVFTAGVIIFHQSLARRYKTEALEERLDAYADIVNAFVSGPGADVDSLLAVLPSELRLTWISPEGAVVYDNLFADPAALENHARRPEVVRAAAEGRGSDIRTSVSNDRPYLYYAKYYGNGYIRVALPYDVHVQSFLKPDNAFLYFILALLVVGVVFINYAGRHFGSSIRRLRDFSQSLAEGGEPVDVPQFPKDELGEIGKQIAGDYVRLKESESKLALEREKLLQHIQSSAEGVCFFNADRSVAFYNGLFLQYLAVVSDRLGATEDILTQDIFGPVREFIEHPEQESCFEVSAAAQGREFLIRVNIFDDRSFEIVLNDVTRQERTKTLKREMTGNISHELRTPVTSIRGYLETILGTPLSPEQQHAFIEKAYRKSLELSELIRDIGLLTKIEDDPSSFNFRPVPLDEIIDRLQAELGPELEQNGTKVVRRTEAGLSVGGNEGLVYTIFRNLAENVVRHAGRGADIIIGQTGRHNGRVYLTFADTGKGIEDEAYLNRLFERFYRADDGRTRQAGGSGLGLAIVKNAVELHGGTISVKNRTGGGIEFAFSLPEA